MGFSSIYSNAFKRQDWNIESTEIKNVESKLHFFE